MKEVIRNDLLLIMLSYSLLLDGYGILSLVIVVLLDSYLLLRQNTINYTYILFGLVASSLLLMLVYYTDLNQSYHLLPFYVIFLGINAALSYQMLNKLTCSFTFFVASILILTFLFMMFLAIIMPIKYYGLTGKINLFLIIVLLYIPYLTVYFIRMIKYYLPNKNAI